MKITQQTADDLKKEVNALSVSVNQHQAVLEEMKKDITKAKKELKDVGLSLEEGKEALLELGKAKEKANKAKIKAENGSKEAQDKLDILDLEIKDKHQESILISSSIESLKSEQKDVIKQFDKNLQSQKNSVAILCDKIKSLL